LSVWFDDLVHAGLIAVAFSSGLSRHGDHAVSENPPTLWPPPSAPSRAKAT